MAARPATRRTGDRPLVAPSRAAVRNFSGGAGYTIEWDVRPVYDFVFSLSEDAGSTDDLPAADRRWLADARSSLPQDVGASARRLFESEGGVQIASIAVQRPELQTPADFVTAVSATAPVEVLRAVLLDAGRESEVEELITAVLAGDRDRLAALCGEVPEAHRAARVEMLADPERTKTEILAVLEAWLERFEPLVPRIEAMLERDHALRAADRGALEPGDLIERTTNGLRWLGEPGIRRVILAPSYFTRPYNYLLGGPDWRFFGYPIADEALDGLDPLAAPQSVVRLHRALGDETRLRILKLLAGRDLYLTEIAQQLDLSKPTIKHHLALLRAAGLVTINEAGTVIYYSLRRQRLDDASVELKAFLVGEAETAGRRPD